MTNNKEKLSKTAKRSDALNKLLSEKASREANPNTEPVQESLMQDLDKAKFLTDTFNSMLQQNNQGNNKDSGLIELQKMKLMKELFTPQPQQKTESTNDTLVKIFGTMFSSLTQQNQNYVGMLFNGMRGGQSQSQEPQLNTWLKGVEYSEKRAGLTHQRSKDELDYSLKERELDIKEQARQDLIHAEERQEIRDDKKSEQIMNIGGVVLDKIVGDNLSTFIGDMMSNVGSKKGKGKRRGRASEEEEPFDVSLLDEL